MSRTQLFQFRLLAPAATLLIVYALLRFLWFPDGYFALSGIGKLLLVLLAVNVVAGPVLSALVYKPGKPGLKFDLVALAGLEFVILGFALLEFDARRPAIAVFAVDRFEVLEYSEIDDLQLSGGPFAPLNRFGLRLVYAELPQDNDTMNRLIEETLFAGLPDIDRRPEFWKPYPEGIGALRKAAQPLAQLLTMNEEQAALVQRWVLRQGAPIDNYIYLPIRARNGDGTMIIHADSGYPVDVLATDPWPDAPGEAP
jgi:hypothetical protein